LATTNDNKELITSKTNDNKGQLNAKSSLFLRCVAAAQDPEALRRSRFGFCQQPAVSAHFCKRAGSKNGKQGTSVQAGKNSPLAISEI